LSVLVLDEGDVTWARISIDGEDLGDRHIVRRVLRPGWHRVAATREGFRRAEGRVRLRPGEAQTLRLRLRRIGVAGGDR
jgi:hypothetical protein